ncbi:hypothetical protein RIB2604_00401270 [Aspergillus luchuensis]|uniref:Uncharacterized protein n=1 Tax=Aspergillus kawachii TaxID=1069201 RepID=A0A146EYR3_ASPKA|nr:hypothetical protein RIB2604_00401270 [Aspergillus luchuensis]
MRSVQQASSDMKRVWLLPSWSAALSLFADPGSQPWITDGLIRTLSMEPTVDNRARQISISIDVQYFEPWTGPMPEMQSLCRFGSFGSMPSMALSI